MAMPLPKYESIASGNGARLASGIVLLHNRVFSNQNQKYLKRFVIQLSITGFTLHLLLIYLSRTLAHPPLLIAEIGRNYLAAISTPFDFILFYEVLTLIAALPASTTRSMANQFEIVSLIFIRDVFRDIATATELLPDQRITWKAAPVFFDMWAGLVMFLLVFVFQYVASKRVRPGLTPESSRVRERYITQKKAVAIALAILLLLMAAYNVGLFVLSVHSNLHGGESRVIPSTNFYNDLFSVMIFTDVLILILSLVVSVQYENVFRNAAFVVAILLIRFALTQPTPYGALLAVLAMAFGILTLFVFNLYSSLPAD